MYNNIENIECTVKLQSGKTDGNPSDLDKHDTNSYPNSEKNGKIVNIKTKKSNVFSRKKQMVFGCFLVCLIFVNLCGVCLGATTISDYVKRIVASWAPNSDIGKIKFVSTDGYDDFMEVISMGVFDFTLPFKAGYATQNDEGRIFINGNGEIMVVSCYDCTVSDIEVSEGKKNVTFDLGYNIKVVYIGLDNIGVEVGNKLSKGESVGTSKSSMIEIQVLYKNKVFDKFKVNDGKISLM